MVNIVCCVTGALVILCREKISHTSLPIKFLIKMYLTSAPYEPLQFGASREACLFGHAIGISGIHIFKLYILM